MWAHVHWASQRNSRIDLGRMHGVEEKRWDAGLLRKIVRGLRTWMHADQTKTRNEKPKGWHLGAHPVFCLIRVDPCAFASEGRGPSSPSSPSVEPRIFLDADCPRRCNEASLTWLSGPPFGRPPCPRPNPRTRRDCSTVCAPPCVCATTAFVPKMPMPRACSKTGPTSAPSRNCWATRT
jgi:hypothetical protein